MLTDGPFSLSKSASLRDMRVASLPWSRIAKVVCIESFTSTTSLTIAIGLGGYWLLGL